MKRAAVLIALLTLAAACTDQFSPVSPTAPGPTGSDAALESESQGQDRYIVVLDTDPSNSVDVSEDVADAYALTTDLVYTAVLAGFTTEMTPEQAEVVADDARVAYVEPDGVMSTTETQSPVGSWGQDRIDQRNLPLDDSYTYNTTGAGVHFYGLDTGIRSTHAEFTSRMGNGFSTVGPGTEDCNGHGTHTASTAAGTTYGVAKEMTVHPVRVLDCGGSGSTSGVIAGMDWVAQNAILPAVANMSLGGGASQAMDDAVARMVEAGVFVAVSAGNSNTSACFQSPARAPEAHTTASTTPSDFRSSFSNFGPCVDIFAPGSGITGAWWTSNTATAVLSGTSMAAPHVAGVAGLILDDQSSQSSLTPAQVGELIQSNATSGVVSNPGSGSPNLLLYMGFITGGPPNQPPTANWTYQCDANITCTFDGSSSSDPDGTIVLYEWLVNANVVRTGESFTHTFEGSRSLTLTLRVTDDGGLSGTLQRTVSIGPNEGDDPPSPPAPPSDLTATAVSESEIDLAWTDNSPDETGFLIERSPDGVGGWTQIATVGENVTTYTDSGLDPDTEYFYRVRADGPGGPSAYSNAASATTLPAPPPNQPPTAEWTYQCDAHITCTFDGSSSFDPDGTIVLYEWIYNGNVIRTVESWSHTFEGSRSLTLTLRVTDDDGLTGTQQRTVSIGPNLGG